MHSRFQSILHMLPAAGKASTAAMQTAAHCPARTPSTLDVTPYAYARTHAPLIFKNKQQLKNKINTADSAKFIIFACS